MSGSVEEQVKSAVPIPDLSILDEALRGDDAKLKEALKKLRPADVGRDWSRRDPGDVRRIVQAQRSTFFCPACQRRA